MPTTTDAGISYKRLEDDPSIGRAGLNSFVSPILPKLRLRPGDEGEDRYSIKAAVLADKKGAAAKAEARRLRDPNAFAAAELKSIPEGEWERWSQQTGRCIFFPSGPRKTQFDMLMLVLILYSCVMVPFRIGLGADAQGNMYFFEIFVSVCFITDLFLNFWTAYQDGDMFVVNHEMIVLNYLSSWFTIDLLSSFPLELVELVADSLSLWSANEDGTVNVENGGALRMLRALRLVRLLRLLRLLKVSRYIGMLEEKVDVNLQILQLIKMILGLLYLMHLLGCFWFYLAAHPPEGAEATWLSSYDGGSGVDASIDIQYLYSVYWALMTLTTVGYGDITPANDQERWYALMSLLVGALVFGYILSSVGDLMGNIDQNAVAVDAKLTDVKNLMRWHRVPRQLALRITRFYEFYYTRTTPLDEELIMDGMPPSLRREMREHLLSRSVVSRVPIMHFSGMRDLDLQLEAYAMLKPINREPKEVLREAGAPAESIWFLSRGSIEAIGPSDGRPSDAQHTKPPATINITFYDARETGDLLGEAAIANRPGFERLVARLRSELFVLSIDDLTKLMTRVDQKARDQVATFVIALMVKRQRARSSSLQMTVRRLEFGLKRRAEELGLDGGAGALPVDDPLVRYRAAVVVQRAVVRVRINAFVEDDYTTVDEMLPAIYGETAKARAQRTEMSGPHSSSLTPRDAVIGAITGVGGGNRRPSGEHAPSKSLPGVAEGEPFTNGRTSPAQASSWFGGHLGGQQSWRPSMPTRMIRPGGAQSHRPVADRQSFSPPVEKEAVRAARDVAERKVAIDSAVEASEKRMVAAMEKIVAETISAQLAKHEAAVRQIVAQEVAGRIADQKSFSA